MDISLADIDCSVFLIDPQLKEKELKDSVKNYPEFKKPLSVPLACAIKYIILMYDISNQEVQSLYPDFGDRRRACAELAGFELTEEGFDEEVELIILNSNPDFNGMVIRYVRMFNNPDYVPYVSYWNMLVIEMRNAMIQTKSSAISTSRTNIQSLNKEINDISTRMFRGDDTEALKRALYANMEREKLNLRPEDIANQIQNGKLKIKDDPYIEAD